jgi:hypothetical protein
VWLVWPCCWLIARTLDEAADQGFRPVRDMGVQGQNGFRPDDTLDPQDLTQGSLQVVRVGGHHPAPDVTPARDLMYLKNLGEEPKRTHHAVQLTVRYLDRHKGDDVVSHRPKVDLPAAVVKYSGAEHAPYARLRRVPRDTQRFAELTNLDPGIADKFQQDLQVGGVEVIQTVTFGYQDEP